MWLCVCVQVLENLSKQNQLLQSATSTSHPENGSPKTTKSGEMNLFFLFPSLKLGGIRRMHAQTMLLDSPLSQHLVGHSGGICTIS